MSPALQTAIALTLVAVATAFLLWRWLRRPTGTGCGGECGAVSPEVRRLRDRLR